MSDHEENIADGRYSTPVPELDDHRHQSSSVQRSDRPRRGTFDSLYGAHQATGNNPQFEQVQQQSAPVREFEEAVDDEDAAELSPSRHSRRPTVESTMDPRSSSPPNSVKAFAEARRREREMSFSEQRPDRKPEDYCLHRTASAESRHSRHSYRSRLHAGADDVASLATNKSAEEDVCFPLQDRSGDDSFAIDFDYLEELIQAGREARLSQRKSSNARTFPDLRPESGPASTTLLQLATSDGDILDVPSDASIGPEKNAEADNAAQDMAPRPQPADPSRVSFFSTAWESTIHAADMEGLILPGEDIRGLFSFPKEETDGVWWLNINRPSEEEVRAVCRAFRIHPLTIEDITTQESREKIELFPSYYFACFRSFHLQYDEETQEQEYVPFNMYVVVFREGTLSFSYASNSHASRVRGRITTLKDYVALSSDWICYALIDDIVDSFAPVISKIEDDTDQIEDEVFIARTDDLHQFLRKIGIVRKTVMGLMRLLGGKADVLKGFTKRCNENYKVTPRMDIGLYLGDIQDHVVTMMTNLAHFEKMLSRSHGNYIAQISIDGITQSANTNRVLSKITVLASIIVPLNVVTSLFGMNVMVPFQNVENLIAFFCIVSALITFSLIALTIAWRLRYI